MISISDVKVIDLFLLFGLFVLVFLSWDKRLKIMLINDATVSPTGQQSYSSLPPQPPTSLTESRS